MTPVIVIAGFILAIILMRWNIGVMRRFQRDYPYDGKFKGQRYECIVRFANYEYGMQCSVGANTSALYLFHSDSKRLWGSKRGRLTMDLQIPWTNLSWREKKSFLTDSIWFEMPDRKIFFYVPQDVGDKVLADAERKIPVDV